MRATQWLKFLTTIMPVLREIAASLYKRHNGDSDKALKELSAIRDHLGEFETFEQGIRVRLERLKARAT